MFALRKALILSTLLLGAFSSPAPSRQEDSIVDWSHFSSLLDSVDPSALHNVLHSLTPKFKDGVFSKDRSAIEHVHSMDPVMASKLVHIAKRQGNSTGIAPVPVPVPSTPAQTSQSIASVSRAQSVSSVLSSAIYASTVPAATTILVAPSTPTSATAIRTTNGAVVYSTFGGGVVTLTSSDVGVHFTRSTSTHLYYTTLPNGEVQTSTDIVVVNAPVTDAPSAAAATGAAETTGSDASVRNGATSTQAAGALLALAVVAGAMLAL